jgi:hypothetical protein
MGNTFTFFDQFFKTLYPNIYDLENDENDENDDEEQNINEEDHLVEDKIINITDDCKCNNCYLQRKIRELVFGTKDKND